MAGQQQQPSPDLKLLQELIDAFRSEIHSLHKRINELEGKIYPFLRLANTYFEEEALQRLKLNQSQTTMGDAKSTAEVSKLEQLKWKIQDQYNISKGASNKI